MSLPKYFISCDWGTTNFRLRLVETSTLNVLAEHKTDQGIKTIYGKFLDQQAVNQTQFFSDYLKAKIQQLSPEHQHHRVVAAGMASANIGLCALPYADLPFDQSGEHLVWQHISQTGLDLLLISGVKSAAGMMRGEETQAIGLVAYIGAHRKGILLLPGTHSKHLTYEQGTFQALKTFMTGELFELLTKKSILAGSVASSEWSGERVDAFEEGLKMGLEGQLTSGLFSIRAKHVLHNHKKEDNYYTLSGMLIGDELSYLKDQQEPVFLAAPDPVFSLYKKALASIASPSQMVLLDGKILEKAFLIGQKKILQLHVK